MKYYIKTHALTFQCDCEKEAAEYLLTHKRNTTAILFCGWGEPASNHIMERIRFNIMNDDREALERRLIEGHRYVKEHF